MFSDYIFKDRNFWKPAFQYQLSPSGSLVTNLPCWRKLKYKFCFLPQQFVVWREKVTFRVAFFPNSARSLPYSKSPL